MKRILLLYVLLGLSAPALLAQCVADAGKDTAACVGDTSILLFLGGTPAATGGIPPYSYTWTTNDPYGMAGYSLNDTTLSNPMLELLPHGAETFYLLVKDSAGNTCTDTVTIFGSIYYYHATDLRDHIHRGDSVRLGTIAFGGLPPFTYLWQPTHGLLDSTIVNPMASPYSTTVYSLTIWDSIGCEAGNYHTVIVSQVSVEEIASGIPVKIMPHPIEGNSIMKLDSETEGEFLVMIFDAAGKKISSIPMINGEANLNRQELLPGMYFFSIADGSELISRGKLMVR